MDASCYTVRPGPHSGWLTFFELAYRNRGPGFFFVIGPASAGAAGPDPEQRRLAQEAARAVVNAYKTLRDPASAEWISAVRRLVAAGRTPLEFGAVVGAGPAIYFFTEGRVRLVPLTAGARRRWERDLPRAGELNVRSIEGGDRYFLGRVPGEIAGGLPSADLLEGIERGGSSDGALILTFHGPETVAATPERESAEGNPVTPAAVRNAKPAGPAAGPQPPPPPIVTPLAPVAPPPPATPPAPPSSVTPPPIVTPLAPVAQPPPAPPPTPPTLVTPPVIKPVGPDQFPEEAPRRRAVWPIAVASVLALAILAAVAWFLLNRPARTGSAVPVSAPVAESAPASTPADTNVAETMSPNEATTPAASLPGGAATRAEPGIIWTARLPGAVTASPLVIPGHVIVGCRDGWLYGLDPGSGSTQWRVAGRKGFGGTAVAGDSLIYAGCFDGVLRAIEPGTGRIAWEFPTAGRITSAPVLSENRVITTSYDFTAYAVDALTGRLVWKTRLGGILWATPALGRKLLFVPGLDGVLTAINPKWGSVAWRFKAPAAIYSHPEATDSVVVFGCDDGYVYGLEPEYGRLVWRTKLGRPAASGIGAADGVFFAGDDGGTLHALAGRDGRELWAYRAAAAIKSTPVIEQEAVIFSSHDGFIHAVSRADGAAIGRVPLDSPLAASPAIAADLLYAGTHDGRVVAFRLR